MPSPNQIETVSNDRGGACSIDPRTEADRGAMRRMMTRYPSRFAQIDPKKRRQWLMLLDEARKDAADVESPSDRGNLRASIAKTALMMDRIEQADEHHADEMQLGKAHLALDAAQALAQLGDAQKRALIEQAGLAH